MGRTLLILLAGFAASFGVLAMSKNQRFVDSVDQMVDQFAGYNAQNAAASGAYMALHKLYKDPAWRAGYSNLVIGGNALNVTVTNDSLGTAPLAHRLKIRASAGNADAADITQVSVFDTPFQQFAVWAKDTVISVVTKDSTGVINTDLLIQNAPFMPKIDKAGLVSAASGQSQVFNEDDESHFHPSHGFPNGSFYHDSTAALQTANVIHVNGDLHVRDNRAVYGIFVVEGDVLLNGNAHIKGVVYLPNATSRVYNRESASSKISGGVVTWGEVDGEGYTIEVKHNPKFMRALVSGYAPDNPPIRVLSWK
jgi:hypothetical protein